MANTSRFTPMGVGVTSQPRPEQQGLTWLAASDEPLVIRQAGLTQRCSTLHPAAFCYRRGEDEFTTVWLPRSGFALVGAGPFRRRTGGASNAGPGGTSRPGIPAGRGR